MISINLTEESSDFSIHKFSGGEMHIRFSKKYASDDQILLQTRLNSSDDILVLLLANDALQRMACNHIECYIPYIPYARQDRVMSPGEPLSIKLFASLINSANFKKVTVFDPHSDVSTALLNNCVSVSNHQVVQTLINKWQLDNYVLISPDLGAYKKIEKLAAFLKTPNEIVTGIKIRNLLTGEIIKSDINSENLNGKNCLIVDDICDGGRTFIELAHILKTKNAGKLYFICSHGIFSHNAVERLQEAGFSRIGTTNSITNFQESNFLSPISIF